VLGAVDFDGLTLPSQDPYNVWLVEWRGKGTSSGSKKMNKENHLEKDAIQRTQWSGRLLGGNSSSLLTSGLPSLLPPNIILS
jgi:hypothetical protein